MTDKKKRKRRPRHHYFWCGICNRLVPDTELPEMHRLWCRGWGR